jgi:hypothetical protein
MVWLENRLQQSNPWISAHTKCLCVPTLLLSLQISGYLADTWNAQEKMSTTTIRKVFTCGAYMGQVGILA